VPSFEKIIHAAQNRTQSSEYQNHLAFKAGSDSISISWDLHGTSAHKADA